MPRSGGSGGAAQAELDAAEPGLGQLHRPGVGHGHQMVAAEPPAERGRGHQLAAGAAGSDGPWLLFLHADTRLEDGWDAAVTAFMADPANAQRAAVFRLCFDDTSPAAQRVARIAAWRSRTLGLPYGDQGLLISKAFYESLGGFKTIPIMEDVDLCLRLCRIGSVKLVPRIVKTSDRRIAEWGPLKANWIYLKCGMSWAFGRKYGLDRHYPDIR